ncbi:MAG: GCN5 family acetyltransferase [Planctomycetaceae bacterium]|nr:GCN5 family acetyltransferase [Planctomycetaceae bacterium]
MKPPKVVDPSRVGTYSPLAGAGGGFVFDEVLEYRVWFKLNGESVFQAFETFEEADAFSKLDLPGIEPVLALVLQREHVNEPEPGKRILVRQRRVAEWIVELLDDDHRRTPENLRRILGDRAA